jgi:hypothetical protein
MSPKASNTSMVAVAIAGMPTAGTAPVGIGAVTACAMDMAGVGRSAGKAGPTRPGRRDVRRRGSTVRGVMDRRRRGTTVRRDRTDSVASKPAALAPPAFCACCCLIVHPLQAVATAV